MQSEFLEMVKYCKNPGATAAGLLDMITEEDGVLGYLCATHMSCTLAVPNVYSFPMLTGEFCELMLQELDHFERSEMPKGRPNTMNNYGVHRAHPYKHYLISNSTV